MKNLKNISILASIVVVLVFVFVGFSNKSDSDKSDFQMKYEARTEVDKIKYTIQDMKYELVPMNDDKKVNKGYSSSMKIDDKKKSKVTIEIIDNDKVVYKNEDIILDFTETKKAKIMIVDDKEGNIDLKIENK